MSVPEDVKELFTILEPDTPLEAGFLITGDGAILSSWARSPVPKEMMSVMAATMMASIATIVEVFGVPTPRTALVNTEDHQILARKVGRDQILFLLTPRSVHKQYLYLSAKRLVTRLEAIYDRAGVGGLLSPRSESSNR